MTTVIKISFLFAVAMLFSLQGCVRMATIDRYNPAVQRTSRTVNLTYAQTLDAIKQWCKEYDFKLTVISEELLIASSDLVKVQSVKYTTGGGQYAQVPCADCGGNMVPTNGVMSLRIEKITEQQTKLSVTFTAKLKYEKIDKDCKTTYKIEDMIFDFVK